MSLSDREKDLTHALKGTVKSALGLVPVLGQAFAGYDSYKRSIFERNINKTISYLEEKVHDLEKFGKNEWLRSDAGQQFAGKVIDAAVDEQLEDKQELFINALINGVNDQSITQLEKLKFVDMLRHLSLASLIVLSEMHKMLIGQVRGDGRNPDSSKPYPLVDPTHIAQKLAAKYDPYLVTSSISEMESQGLFSRTGEWRKDYTGILKPGGGFATELCYTNFTARFVEFISQSPPK